MNKKVRRKYTKELLEPIVKKSKSVSDVLTFLNLKHNGSMIKLISKRIQEYDLDTSHFTYGSLTLREKPSRRSLEPEFILVKRKSLKRENSSLLKKCLIKIGRKYECEKCLNNGIWNGHKITLQIDHIDGDFSNDTPENLRFLCPNCHSQTGTYGNKSKINKDNFCLDCLKKIAFKSERCYKCSATYRKSSGYAKWHSERPTKEELENLIRTMSWCAIGRKYDVTDNAVRKWARNYKLL